MSVAPDLPPIVHIPARARRSCAPQQRAQHLSLVAPVAVPAPVRTPARTPGRPRPTHEVPIRSLSRGAAAARARRTPVWEDLNQAVPPARTPLRLTGRGVAVVAALIGLLAGAMLLVAAMSSSAAPTAPVVPASVTVHSGDTLWSIANEIAPAQDPRGVVDNLMARNHLTSTSLTPGQTLKVR
ncbi:LysM peptidoglycan-binding domain-containing protein [Jatrophihabitans telluris]|uniref:LysM peptidoglycan-binding domain-containing protein n=1 Tax=Jatrophihabitans telluris TaxID=2038343 RepID=A0ABY4QSF1_9ACTN|nr:LysM peptidoglycan-binding domain-containing protein [Jatrophihabitans telluris]UQX86735.1 LysM peptidoglycan-binding domain-containing protein [Jatrophihabitans telluris]